MQDFTARSLVRTWEDWPSQLRGWFGYRDEEDEPEPPQRRFSGGERRLLALVLLGCAVIVGWWWWDRGPEVKVVAVRTGNAAEVVYATGIVEQV
jgi:ferric-dicitrate binding protein FerR (iron transport regulator)